MNEAEFDKFADEYFSIHAKNIRLSGESPDYFAAYKVKDVSEYLGQQVAVEEFAGTILDFGCGVGTSTPHFRRHFPKATLYGVDVSRRSLAIGEERFKGDAVFLPFDGRALPFETDSIDVVFAACVYHHIAPALHMTLLSETRRVLKPGGHLFIFEHNPFNPLTVSAVNGCEFDCNAILVKPGVLSRKFRDAGFHPVKTKFRVFFPGPLRALRVLERWLTWLPLGAQYCVIGQKPA